MFLEEGIFDENYYLDEDFEDSFEENEESEENDENDEKVIKMKNEFKSSVCPARKQRPKNENFPLKEHE